MEFEKAMSMKNLIAVVVFVIVIMTIIYLFLPLNINGKIESAGGIRKQENKKNTASLNVPSKTTNSKVAVENMAQQSNVALQKVENVANEEVSDINKSSVNNAIDTFKLSENTDEMWKSYLIIKEYIMALRKKGVNARQEVDELIKSLTYILDYRYKYVEYFIGECKRRRELGEKLDPIEKIGGDAYAVNSIIGLLEATGDKRAAEVLVRYINYKDPLDMSSKIYDPLGGYIAAKALHTFAGEKELVISKIIDSVSNIQGKIPSVYVDTIVKLFDKGYNDYNKEMKEAIPYLENRLSLEPDPVKKSRLQAMLDMLDKKGEVTNEAVSGDDHNR